MTTRRVLALLLVLAIARFAPSAAVWATGAAGVGLTMLLTALAIQSEWLRRRPRRRITPLSAPLWQGGVCGAPLLLDEQERWREQMRLRPRWTIIERVAGVAPVTPRR